MKLYVSIPALVAAGLLSACDSTTLSSQLDDANSFIEALETGDSQEVDVDDLPDNATMNGYLAAGPSVDEGVVFIGDATADFNFANGGITGSASNFNEYDITEEDGVLTRTLGGSMIITGNIDGTGFDYYAFGGLTSEDEELGSLVAEVYVDGEGEIFTVDGKLTAYGEGEGDGYLYSSDGYLGYSPLYSLLVLQE
jgi:hypothetical protein